MQFPHKNEARISKQHSDVVDKPWRNENMILNRADTLSEIVLVNKSDSPENFTENFRDKPRFTDSSDEKTQHKKM